MGANGRSRPQSRLGHLLRRAGVVGAVTYGSAAALGVGFADRLIFLPPPPSYDQGLGGLVRLESAAGDTIAARLSGPPDATTVILFAHGNAEDLGHGRYHAEAYAELGVAVLTFDYPGYGLSSGRPSEEGAYAAVDAAYRFLVQERGFAPERVVAHGRSLGGGVIVDLASREAVGGLVIESSFVSAYRVMTGVPLVPVDQFTSLKKLPDVSAPVLVIHGDRDQVIAEWHGRRLYEAVPEERRAALWVPGAGHNDLAAVAGDRYWAALAAFLERVAAEGGR